MGTWPLGASAVSRRALDRSSLGSQAPQLGAGPGTLALNYSQTKERGSRPAPLLLLTGCICRSVDLNHVVAGRGSRFGTDHELFRHRIELSRLRALGPGQRDRNAAITTLADGRDQLDRP
jgi:hypothetical protein